MIAQASLPSWPLERPWRNCNPGDLRCLPDGERWDGQAGTDFARGGPFAIFSSRTMGWRALAVCLLTYFEKHGLNTIDGIVDRYAPPGENNTAAYKTLVSGRLGIKADEPTNLRLQPVMLAFVSAIALAEGSARVQWIEAEKVAGVQLALGISQATRTLA
jgi:hypothetical protein